MLIFQYTQNSTEKGRVLEKEGRWKEEKDEEGDEKDEKEKGLVVR